MSAEAAKERLDAVIHVAMHGGDSDRHEDRNCSLGRLVPAVRDALLAHGDDLLVARGGEQVVDWMDRPLWVFPVSQEQST